jgi:PIN domain nuclease of toxin-antitoxin system
MIKHSIGKINITFNPLEMAMEMGLETLNFTGEDALLLKSLPFFHKDPFDRMLVAQSMTNNLTLMSDDSKIKKYDCKLIWVRLEWNKLNQLPIEAFGISINSFTPLFGKII